jgi:hypothetical protein
MGGGQAAGQCAARGLLVRAPQISGDCISIQDMPSKALTAPAAKGSTCEFVTFVTTPRCGSGNAESGRVLGARVAVRRTGERIEGVTPVVPTRVSIGRLAQVVNGYPARSWTRPKWAAQLLRGANRRQGQTAPRLLGRT